VKKRCATLIDYLGEDYIAKKSDPKNTPFYHTLYPRLPASMPPLANNKPDKADEDIATDSSVLSILSTFCRQEKRSQVSRYREISDL